MDNLSDYARCLSVKEKNRYVQKLNNLNGVDPYTMSASDFNLCLDDVPTITMNTILNFFIFGISKITHNEIRAFKSLEAFIQFSLF